MIDTIISEPFHQNQNPAERRGGALKANLQVLLHNTPWAPLNYWCYAISFLAKVRRFLAKKQLGWQTGEECLNGETVDISVFCFPWFSPIWYYDPSIKMPKHKMRPGYFLNIEENIGDAFTYQILPVKDITKAKGRRKHITRSVIRLRTVSDDEPPIVIQNLDDLKFTDINGNELDGDVILKPKQNDNHNVNDSQIDDDISQSEDEQHKLSSKNIADCTTIPIENLKSNDEINNETVILKGTDVTSMPFDNCNKINVISQDDTINSDGDESTSNESTLDEILPLKIRTSDEDSITSIDSDAASINDEATRTVSQDLNNHFIAVDDEDDDISEILNHKWTDGVCELNVKYYNGAEETHPLEMVRADDPLLVAKYITSPSIKHNSQLERSYGRWARHFQRKLRRIMRRLGKVFHSYDSQPIGRKPRTQKKPGTNKRVSRKEKYGIVIPNNYKAAVQEDIKNGNTLWQTAVRTEIAALIHHECFEFKDRKFKPNKNYQFAPLRLVFELKQDFRRKARLVIQGFKVDPRDLSTRSTVVKGVSVRLLDVIAHRDNLKTLCGDIGNAFIQAKTLEKVYTICGPEFGEYHKCIAIIKRALYGLTTSALQWRNLFADFLRSMGFKATRYDRDVWLRPRSSKSGYDYICTHVDDFKIVARDPNIWMNKIKDNFLVKSAGEPDYYLGNHYRYEEKERLWTYDCNKYVTEAIRKTEKTVGSIKYRNTPLPTEDCHPEMDDSELLSKKNHKLFQQLLGMGIWMVIVGRPDICYAIASLGRFGACPRQGHLDLMIHIYGYLKKFPKRRIAIDSTDVDLSQLPDVEKLKADFLHEYDDAIEEIDSKFPTPYGRELQITFLVDSDHGHDHKTRRSITGLIGFVGSTPVIWFSKRQGSVATSTYSAEFMALRQGTEECINMRYMLRCLGIPVTKASNLFGDNLGVIQNAANVDSDLKKKHVALSFHMVREAIAAGIIAPQWIKGNVNASDIMTKQIGGPEFRDKAEMLFWTPLFRK